MVRNIIEKNKKVFDYVIIGLLCAIILVTAIATILDVFDGGFFDGVAEFFALITFIGLLGILLFALLTKRTNLAKLFGMILLIYWVVSSFFGVGGAFSAFDGGKLFMILYAIFAILADIAFVGALVLYVLSAMFGKDTEKLLDYCLLAFLGLQIFVFAFREIEIIVNGFKVIPMLTCMMTELFMPALGVIGFIYLAPKKLTK